MLIFLLTQEKLVINILNVTVWFEVEIFDRFNQSSILRHKENLFRENAFGNSWITKNTL